jgi:UDP-N-acetylmuramoylalanine--D-glutamate ligase
MDAAAATVLNLSEDHLDRYADMDAYAASKARIFQGTGVQILNRDDVRSLGMRLPGRRVITFGRDAPASASDWGIVRIADRTWLARGADAVMATAELGVPGTHNALNALAALALCDAVGLPLAPLAGALRAFGGLPHRMQLIAVQGDVRFYNDSKGTNVGASRAALEGLGSKCVLIAGGDGKGQDFRPLVEPVRANARAVVLIGRDSAKIEAALRASGVPLSHANDLKEAVERAYLAARPGDAVLLSPACASYDMFRDYRHRGDEFTRIARSLGATPGGPH